MLDRFKNLFGKDLPKTLKKNFRTIRTGNSFTLKNTDYGKINVECDLIRRYVERAAAEVNGIHEVSAIVEPPVENDALAVRFSLSLGHGHSAQSVSADLVKAVKKVLEDVFQIVDVGIYLKVVGIAQLSDKKPGRRVR
ncbi:MAG: hypothetical protein IK062_10620 [Selenomonadaceae bacterium]|nr:hypothetical protein [Selenomonadaceae bacterium]